MGLSETQEGVLLRNKALQSPSPRYDSGPPAMGTQQEGPRGAAQAESEAGEKVGSTASQQVPGSPEDMVLLLCGPHGTQHGC